jgi:hypothetical protein
MYQRLEAVLGIETATALMEHLPPTGWADVATKHDLDGLRRELDLRFETVSHRFDAVELKIEATVHREIRTGILATFAGNAVLAGLILAAVRFV